MTTTRKRVNTTPHGYVRRTLDLPASLVARLRAYVLASPDVAVTFAGTVRTAIAEHLDREEQHTDLLAACKAADVALVEMLLYLRRHGDDPARTRAAIHSLRAAIAKATNGGA